MGRQGRPRRRRGRQLNFAFSLSLFIIFPTSSHSACMPAYWTCLFQRSSRLVKHHHITDNRRHQHQTIVFFQLVCPCLFLILTSITSNSFILAPNRPMNPPGAHHHEARPMHQTDKTSTRRRRVHQAPLSVIKEVQVGCPLVV